MPCACLNLLSFFLFLLVCLNIVLQPFGRALVEAGKAFFNMEQERGAFRGLLEIHAGKCFDLF